MSNTFVRLINVPYVSNKCWSVQSIRHMLPVGHGHTSQIKVSVLSPKLVFTILDWFYKLLLKFFTVLQKSILIHPRWPEWCARIENPNLSYCVLNCLGVLPFLSKFVFQHWNYLGDIQNVIFSHLSTTLTYIKGWKALESSSSTPLRKPMKISHKLFKNESLWSVDFFRSTLPVRICCRVGFTLRKDRIHIRQNLRSL